MKTLSQVTHELDAQICANVCGRDVTRAELRQAFNRVADQRDWKRMVSAIVNFSSDFDLLLTREAVIFFTGSVPTIDVVRFTGGRVYYRVAAAGYYQTIGA